VFLAAVQFLLFDKQQSLLAEYYPSIAESARDPDAQLIDIFRDFCLEHTTEIKPILRDRRTQTNSVRRSAILYPAFAYVSQYLARSPAIIELGSSAGLNLLWDYHQYIYDETTVGRSDSPVTITPTVKGGDPPLPTEPPSIASRIGIDLHPLDVRDNSDCDWLRALIWPEHHTRREALNGAIKVAKKNPPRVKGGDAVEVLPEMLADFPVDQPIVVYNTLMMYQLPEQAREQLKSIIEEELVNRPLHWISGDRPLNDMRSVPENNGIACEWISGESGDCQRTLIGGFEQHGHWIRWFRD
jgi:hypothetical protein